jgi:DNA-binding HxlR family transcriptional regulator
MANEESIKSSNMVDEIWNIIDDKKARLIFYKLKGENLEKVNAIKKYITETLYNDFNNYLDNIKKQMDLVSNQIQELESKGIVIRERAERIQKIKEENLLKTKEQQEDISKRPEIKFWYQKVYYMFVDIFAKLYNFFN